MSSDAAVRTQLLALLKGGNAHMSFDDAVADFPIDQINTQPAHVPYTPWHILEHMRITQWDILAFIRDPNHKSPDWPAGYWPAADAVADERQWQETIDGFRTDQQALVDLIEDLETNLYADLPHAPGYNVLREILVISDHNAYHIGEFAILRQVMGTWP